MTKMLEEIRQQPQVLASLEEANRQTLLSLVEELKERKITHAVFAGRGTSDHASIFAQYVLGITKGVVSGLAMPSCITLYNGQFDFGSDLVVGVSQSGKAADALAVLEQAKARGGVTVAITNDKESPMAKAAKYHLYCNAGLEVSVAATKTFTAQMGLVVLLAAYWSQDDGLLEAFRALPSHVERLLAVCDSQMAQTTLRYRYIEDGFVLSRGISYAVALEAMLKIQETCYVKMKGYAVSDFYHGPLAQVDMDVPVILFAPKGQAEKDNRDMAAKLKDLGVDPLIVTSDPDYAKENNLSFVIPDTGNEITQALLFAVFAQRFAESLCAQKGLNPDAPRNLKKVTVTR